jgi:hypothetical protein
MEGIRLSLLVLEYGFCQHDNGGSQHPHECQTAKCLRLKHDVSLMLCVYVTFSNLHWADVRDGTANTEDPTTISMLHILYVIIIIIILAFFFKITQFCFKYWIYQLFKEFSLLTSTCIIQYVFLPQILDSRLPKNVHDIFFNWVSEQIKRNETCAIGKWNMCYRKEQPRKRTTNILSADFIRFYVCYLHHITLLLLKLMYFCKRFGTLKAWV